MRLLTRALATLALLSGGMALAPMAHAATPQLYLYEGASCAVASQNAAARNMLGRIEDGDDVFITFGTPEQAYVSVDYGLGCYKGQVANVALSVPLGFSAGAAGQYGLTKGASTLADVPAGKLDAVFAHIAQSAVSHGFPAAQMRLGEEMNGGWYPAWAAAGRASAFQAAFCHVKAVMQAAAPTAKFTYWVNPSTVADPSGEAPTCADGVAWDQYASVYSTAGAKAEPQQWANALSGWWGVASMASWGGSMRHAVPEAGVGALGDDPTFMAGLIAYDAAQKAEWFGLWDSNASYAGRISDGSKPGEALEVMKEWSSLAPILAGASLYTGTAYKVSAPTGYHAFLAQLANGDVEQLAWGDAVGQTLQATDLTAQAAVTKVAEPIAAPPKVTGAGQGDVITVKPNADGSGTIHLAFPTTAAAVNYVTYLSPARVLSFSDGKGGPSGSPWNGGKAMGADGWVAKSGSADIHYGPS